MLPWQVYNFLVVTKFRDVKTVLIFFRGSSIQSQIQEKSLDDKDNKAKLNKTTKENKNGLSPLGRLSAPNLVKDGGRKYVKHIFTQEVRPESHLLTKQGYARASKSTNEFQKVLIPVICPLIFINLLKQKVLLNIYFYGCSYKIVTRMCLF